MNNQTPFNEIYLTDTQLHILLEFTPNSPEDIDDSYLPLIDYGLLDYISPHKQGSNVIDPKVAISVRGQQYLKYLAEERKKKFFLIGTFIAAIVSIAISVLK